MILSPHFHTLRAAVIFALVSGLAACGGAPPAPSDDVAGKAAEPELVRPPAPEPQVSAEAPPPAAIEKASSYWGVKPGDPVPINWDDLMPEGGMEALDEEFAAFYAMLEDRYGGDVMGALGAIEEGSAADVMPQLGSFDTVPELDGLYVRLPGYAVPFDFTPDHRHHTFLLAPYMGACIHSPPPPPNQIILIEADPAIKLDDIWIAYWVEGTLKAETQETDLAAAAYTLTLTRIEPFVQP